MMIPQIEPETKSEFCILGLSVFDECEGILPSSFSLFKPFVAQSFGFLTGFLSLLAVPLLFQPTCWDTSCRNFCIVCRQIRCQCFYQMQLPPEQKTVLPAIHHCHCTGWLAKNFLRSASFARTPYKAIPSVITLFIMREMYSWLLDNGFLLLGKASVQWQVSLEVRGR